MPRVGFGQCDISVCAKPDKAFRRPLEAVCMAIVEGPDRAVVMSTDFPGLPLCRCGQLEKGIAAAAGCAPERVLIHTQDTHTGPLPNEMPEGAFQKMSRILSQCACEAEEKLRSHVLGLVKKVS